MFVYKIRRKSDGRYASGGQSGKFTKVGKVWQNAGAVKNHLRAFDSKYYAPRMRSFYDECEIIEYLLTDPGSFPVQDWMRPMPE